MDFNIGGIEVAILVLGIVEFLKGFGLTGKGSQLTALLLGLFFFGLAEAMAQDLVSGDLASYIVVVVKALAASLAAMGFYAFGKKTVLK